MILNTLETFLIGIKDIRALDCDIASTIPIVLSLPERFAKSINVNFAIIF